MKASFRRNWEGYGGLVNGREGGGRGRDCARATVEMGWVVVVLGLLVRLGLRCEGVGCLVLG